MLNICMYVSQHCRILSLFPEPTTRLPEIYDNNLK